MLRDGRLRDLELRVNDGDQFPGGGLTTGQHFEDPPPDRINEDLKGLHDVNI
jgi:hypothetical protein